MDYTNKLNLLFLIDGQYFHTVELGDSMTYLDHKFTFSSDTEIAKADLLNNSKLPIIIDLSHGLLLTPLLKCHAFEFASKSKTIIST